MLPGCIGGFVPVDRIPKWKTDFSTAEERAQEQAQRQHSQPGEATASTTCLGSALFRCSEASTGTGNYSASHQGGLQLACSAQKRESMKGLNAQFKCFSVYPLCVGLSSAEVSGLFVSQEEHAYRPSCLNLSDISFLSYSLLPHQSCMLYLVTSPRTSQCRGLAWVPVVIFDSKGSEMPVCP